MLEHNTLGKYIFVSIDITWSCYRFLHGTQKTEPLVDFAAFCVKGSSWEFSGSWCSLKAGPRSRTEMWLWSPWPLAGTEASSEQRCCKVHTEHVRHKDWRCRAQWAFHKRWLWHMGCRGAWRQNTIRACYRKVKWRVRKIWNILYKNIVLLLPLSASVKSLKR